MKKLFILPIIFILTLTLVFAASVTRTMTSRVDPGSEVEIKLTLNGANVGEAVAIEDTMPNTISLIKSWDISGSEEAKSAVSYVKKASKKEGYDRHSWSFTASSSSPTVTYKIDAPSTEAGYEFDVRWVTSEGFSHQASTLTVRTITCGDGVCEGNENNDNCEADCPKPAPAPPAPEEEVAAGALGWLWIVFIAIIVIGVIVYFTVVKKKKE